MADVVNLRVKLNPTRRRMAVSMLNLFSIISVSDSKKYADPKQRVFLPIFPQDNDAILAAITLLRDRLTVVSSA